MDKEIRNCQNCKNQFTIEPDDFRFYEKIQVPPPTWCPECRMKRRMLFRNEMMFYKRKCDFTGEILFSGYSPEKETKVYRNDIWFSDKWDSMDYGRDYDFSRSFFEQFKNLYREVPVPNRSVLRVVDSDYCNNASDLKNCYLLFNSELSKDCAYGNGITSCNDVYDSYFMKAVERSYEGFVCFHSYNIFFSSNTTESHDIYFSKNLIDCSYCFGCVNLRHKKYMIFNHQYSRDDWLEKFKKFDTGSYSNNERFKKEAKEFWVRFPVKYMHGYHNVNVSGDYITNSRNVLHSFSVDEFENCKFCYLMGLKPTKDCYDFCWGGAAELTYEAVAVGYQISNARFVFECWPGCFDVRYCIFCSSGCSRLFACVGLRNKQYCILNKQYAKEEYEKLLPRIIEHMNTNPYIDSKGRIYKYGEFFPPELSPFAYNETIAQEYYPLTKEEAETRGYKWKDPEPRNYSITKTAKDLPDHIKDVDDSILQDIIECSHHGPSAGGCNEQCTQAFKLIKDELNFYRNFSLPLPRLCPNCRHYERLKQRNPLKLWRRKCQCAGTSSNNDVYVNTILHSHGQNRCPNEFETSYAPERQEAVYCERCYRTEVM